VKIRGEPEDVVREFRLAMAKKDLPYGWDRGTREVEIVSSEVFGSDGSARDWFAPGEEMIIQMDLKANAPVEDPVVSFAIHDDQNRLVYGTNTELRGHRWSTFDGKQRVAFILKSLPFVEGRYYVTFGVHSRDNTRVYHLQGQRYTFAMVRGEENPGLVFIPVECRVERL